MKNKRLVLKLSGEVLQGENAFGISDPVITEIAENIISLQESGYEIGIVIGGGNFFRGAQKAAENMVRASADNIGMLATLQNSIALNDKFIQLGTDSVIFTSRKFGNIGREFNHIEAKQALSQKKIAIFAAGTGAPFFTTDTAAILRALEVEAGRVVKGTKVDGIYDKDPVKHTSAKFFPKISYDKYLQLELKVMDITAISLAREYQLPIKIFNIKKKSNIVQAVKNEEFGSIISN